MKLQKYFLFLLLIIVSCNGSYNKKFDILKIDETYKKGYLEKAKKKIDKYLNKKQDNEYAWTLLGDIEIDLDNLPLATIAYEKALKINPKTVEALTGLGIVSRKKGNYDEALRYYKKSIKIDEYYAEAYTSLVTIYLKKKNFKEAVKVGLKAYKLNKNNPIIAANLSVAYHYDNNAIKREQFFNIAKKSGYKNVETLRLIFNGKYTVFD